MAIIYNLICKFSEISVKIPQVDKLLLKFIWTQNSQKMLTKEDQIGGHNFYNFKFDIKPSEGGVIVS